jgi:hypothetical protein
LRPSPFSTAETALVRNLFCWKHVFILVRDFGKLLAKMALKCFWRYVVFSAFVGASSVSLLADAVASFQKEIKPLIAKYCSDCHEDGANKGNVAFDNFKSDQELIDKHELWARVLKNVRMGLMPPEKKKQRPSPEDVDKLAHWIKYQSFHLDPANPDPGRVTIHRLNREEYRNTVRDLMGVDFNTDDEFPPDDSGYGFDNIGDVLTISPLLLEKYLQAAEKIVTEAVPTVARVISEKEIKGREFKGAGRQKGDQISVYKEGVLSHTVKIDRPGDYRVFLDLAVHGSFDFDPGRCELVFKINGQEKLRQEFGWEDNKKYQFEYPEKWETGEYPLEFEIKPLKTQEEGRKTFVNLTIASARIQGPMEKQFWAKTKNYDRFFTRDEAPSGENEKLEYARELLRKFATKAFRRPVDDKTVNRLASIAESVYNQPGKSLEEGVRHAMVAVLASPRFLFRIEEGTDPAAPFALIDEPALASRLSYFLWSTMPDEELSALANRGELRKNLGTQVKRLLADSRSKEFIENFTGQWLQVRDVAGISINERAVFARERTNSVPSEGRRRFQKPKAELDGELRRAMERETRMFFANIVKEDRDVREMLDSDYTFLNERLATHYEIPGVTGNEMRLVKLPENSPRGGLITQGSVLVVTSNPTRTSPVKRGLFVLENFIGAPPPPPPADIPALEEASKEVKDHEPSLRETLEIHRAKPLCSSCHNRMDPLGLALDNFNALGMWRDRERGQPLDVAGRLITGETFSNIRELKKILVTRHYDDFYRCLTEKVLTYALGRGLDYYDVETVDQIVQRLETNEGHFSALLMGVIESTPFQKRRNISVSTASAETNIGKKEL